MIKKNDKFIKLVEVADTWQGEGPSTGRQMLIARFKHCNLHCQFCDTWIKMKTTTEGSYSINDINKALEKTRGLMITGGEPTLQVKDINNLDATLAMIEYCTYQTVNVETNGCNIEFLLDNLVYRKGQEVKIMYSPKVFTQKDYDVEVEKVKKVINNPLVYMKIVADKCEISEKFIKEVSTISEDKGKIYLMPLGITIDEITENWNYCIDLADATNTNISTRMHIMNQFT